MAHHKSALKRIRQSRKLKLYNRLHGKTMKMAIREVKEASNFEEATEKFRQVTKILDKNASRGILHKNTAANRKSSLARIVNSKKTTV